MIIEQATIIKEGRLVTDTIKIGKSKKVINCKNKLLIKGFVNGHVHLASRLISGLGSGLKKYDLLRKIIFKAHKERTVEDVYNASLLACIESIRCGVTSLLTMDVQPEPVIKALKKAGLNFITCMPLKDRLEEAMSVEEQLKKFKKLRTKYGSSFILGLANELESSPELIKKTFDLANKERMGVHMHVCETKEEVAHMKKLTGLTTINYLESVGGLSSNLTLAHCVHTTSKELQLIADNKVSLVHCPTSNVYSDGSVPKIREWLNKGIKTYIGTDEFPYNPNPSVLSEAIKASKYNKLSNEEIIRLANNQLITKNDDYVLLSISPKAKSVKEFLSEALKGRVSTVIINDEIKLLEGELMIKLNEAELKSKVNEACKRITQTCLIT